MNAFDSMLAKGAGHAGSGPGGAGHAGTGPGDGGARATGPGGAGHAGTGPGDGGARATGPGAAGPGEDAPHDHGPQLHAAAEPTTPQGGEDLSTRGADDLTRLTDGPDGPGDRG
jgi:hypothetical protein